MDDRFIPNTLGRTLPCIRCDKVLHSLEMMADQSNHPNDATCFESHGQYGSTQFDPGDGSRIELNLCDDCVVAVAKTHLMYFEYEDDNDLQIVRSSSGHQALRDKVKAAAHELFPPKPPVEVFTDILHTLQDEHHSGEQA